MNPFDQIRAEVLRAIEDCQRAGELPEALDVDRITVEPPRDPTHGDAATNAALLLAKPAGRSTHGAGRAAGGEAARRRRRRDGGGGATGVRQSAPARRLLAGAGQGRAGRRPRLRRGRPGPWQAGQRRVLLRQSDRAAPRRARARHRVRRRAGQPAREDGLRGDARILRQRPRRPGRRAGALGAPPLSGSARPGSRGAARKGGIRPRS